MTSAKTKSLLIFFFVAVAFIAISAVLVFGGVFPLSHQQKYSDSDFDAPQFSHRFVDFRDLPGWLQDDLAPAFEAFLRSCAVFDSKDDQAPANPYENLGVGGDGFSFAGVVADWRKPCEEARQLNMHAHTDADSQRSALRSFFEFYFRPAQILTRRDPLPDGRARRAGAVIDEIGVFTGYFEPTYSASRFQTSEHTSPLYLRPNDLIDVDLGEFREDLKGERIAGRVEQGRLVQYPDRREINAGALTDSAAPFAWLDPNDLFFLQIQGSGQLFFSRDNAVRVSYAGQNGRPYTAIGRVMAEREILPLEEISMQSIREWLENAHPSAARELREQNASYVFFRDLGSPEPGLGPPGAQGVSVTPERSLAVDRRYHALGAPIWIDIDPVEAAGAGRIQQLMIAQDTGGAIRGPIRGDYYWGSGPAAGEIAGKMNARGRMYVLVPRTVAAKLADRKTP